MERREYKNNYKKYQKKDFQSEEEQVINYELKENINIKEFIFGIRPIMEALEAGKTFDRVFIQNGLLGDSIKNIKTELSKLGVRINYVPLEKLNRITRKNHQGVIAYLSPIEFYKVEDLVPKIYEEGKDPFILILDRLTDVRNFGAIARTAEICGVDMIIISDKESSPINADSVKTSAGALFNIKICKESNLGKIIDYLKKCGIKIVCATEKTDKLIYEESLPKPIAIVMGSEGEGISKDILEKSDLNLKLPIFGKTQSLNVSVACGAFLYEVIRQNLKIEK